MKFHSKQLQFSWICVLFSFISLTANAQLDEPIPDTLYSNVLKEKRPLQVILPKSYKKDSQQKYGVMYYVDGEWAKGGVYNNYDFLVGAKFVPEQIYVLIPNLYIKETNLRDRDLTPTKVIEYSSLSGGADKFIAFLKKELIPYINQKYSTTGNNTLVGSSLGGLFTIYTFLKEPQLFKSYVTSEASLMWDNMYVNKLALETLPKLTNLENTTLWFAGRVGRHFREMGMAEMDSILKVMAPKNLIWKSATYPNETHYTLGYKGTYDGYKFTFKGYQKELRVAPLNGVLLKDEPFTALAWQFKDSLSLYYTTDGSEPTRSSKEFNFFIPLDSTASLTVKSINNRSDYDQIVKGEFKLGKIVMPKKKTKSATGLNYSLYEGSWETLPDVKKLKAAKSIKIEKDFHFNKDTLKNDQVHRIEGQLEIPVDGYYVFLLESVDDVMLVVDDQVVLKGKEKAYNRRQSYVLPLAKGIHSLQLTFLQNKDTGKPNFIIYQDKLKEKDFWWDNEFLNF